MKPSGSPSGGYFYGQRSILDDQARERDPAVGFTDNLERHPTSVLARSRHSLSLERDSEKRFF